MTRACTAIVVCLLLLLLLMLLLHELLLLLHLNRHLHVLLLLLLEDTHCRWLRAHADRHHHGFASASDSLLLLLLLMMQLLLHVLLLLLLLQPNATNAIIDETRSAEHCHARARLSFDAIVVGHTRHAIHTHHRQGVATRRENGQLALRGRGDRSRLRLGRGGEERRRGDEEGLTQCPNEFDCRIDNLSIDQTGTGKTTLIQRRRPQKNKKNADAGRAAGGRACVFLEAPPTGGRPLPIDGSSLCIFLSCAAATAIWLARDADSSEACGSGGGWYEWVQICLCEYRLVEELSTDK